MPPVSTPEGRSLAARIGAHTKWANCDDRSAATAPARAGLEQKFLNEAGGDPIKAEHLRKAHFARLALRSAEARRKSRELSEQAQAAEAELRTLGESA